ncbi:MAG: PVC-type heme-binding CxxCH protein [Planctomycetaceae bacterium]
MLRLMSVAALLGLVVTAGLSAGEQQLNGHNFTLPDGFEIELVATSPLVDRPITADFDEQGRLYVADSSGSNEPVVKQVVDRTHRIMRLVDVDGDGKYDTSTVFADKMMFPEGTLWHEGSLYVSAPPSIWKLTDTNDDGVADERVEWHQGKTLTGCANDLHGPYLGLDGYIYWCKGAFAEQTYEQPGKPPLVSKAAHIFRRKADGTGYVENVMTGGMDNPVDVVFTPGGERIFTTTFLQRPGGGLRDGLIHAIYGGVYGKVHDSTNFHPRTGDLMPPLVHMGPAAPCGLTRYESNFLGDEFRDNLFACQFNMYKVSRHVLEDHGATFKTTDSDFVVSTNIDFHPTDVLEDADGSIVICDTGGWYRLCCPTSQLEKPDVIGAVYRVRRQGMKTVEDPRGLKLDWGKLSATDLAKLLGDPRPAVQRRAIRDLAKHDAAKVVAALGPILGQHDAATAATRVNAVWTLTRVDAPQARALVRGSISDPDANVRHAALSSVSFHKDREALPLVMKVLQSGSPQDVRISAEILGRLEEKSAVPALLEAASHQPAELEKFDRILEHSITFALIQIADREATAAGLTSSSPWTRRSALIALDQMPNGQLTPEKVVPLLTSDIAALRQTSLWMVGRHPEWGDALTQYLREQLARDTIRDTEQDDLKSLLAQFAGTASVQQLLASYAKSGAASDGELTVRKMCLEAMSKSGLKQMPDSWLASLTKMIAGNDATLKPNAVTVVRSLPLPEAGTSELSQALLALAKQTEAKPEVRIDAIAALPAGRGELEPELFSLLVTNLGEDASVATRSAAVDALAKAKLSTAQQAELADAIAKVGPLELNRLLGIFENSTDEAVGTRLVAALKQSPVLTSLRVDAVKTRVAKFPEPVQKQAEELYAAINVEAAKQKERLDELLTHVGTGDIRRGQAVFANSKASCVACHAIGYKGGNVGPDLSRIGKIRTERDLLESVLFPSVSLVRSYEPILVVTTAGKAHNGLIRRETPDEIVLVTGAKDEVRIARSEIEEIRPSTVSVMPAGLDTQLTREQIIDLIAYLKSRQ